MLGRLQQHKSPGPEMLSCLVKESEGVVYSESSAAKDYHPISLSTFILKDLERLVDHFIRSNLEPSLLSLHNI